MKTVTTPPIKIELSVHTDFFQDDYALVIDGNVSMMLPNVPVTVLITEPNGNIVYISQLEIDTKGRFGDTHNINKSLWQKSGKYTITATYGADENNATRIIDYKTTEPELINELQVNASGKFHTVYYLMEGGSFAGYATNGTNVLTILTNTFADGKVSFRIPRQLLDAKKDGEDDDFFVLVDGEEVDFDEKKNTADRTLTIEFAMGIKEILIVGTTIIGGEALQKNTVKILEGSSTPQK